MNKMGNTMSTYKRYKEMKNRIKSSYVYRLISKVFSCLCTLVLIFLLVIGGLMFFFNMKAKSYAKMGQSYTPPFGLYTIISGSMEPNIHVYDVVVVKEEKELSTIKVGDVITFISSWDLNYGDTVTHRVISIAKTENGEFQFSTKGDYNETQDGAVVTQSNLVGRVIMRIPQLGRVQFFLASKMGWFIAIFLPALVVIIMDCIKIFKLFTVKGNIENVTDSKDIDKVCFEGELLNEREIDDKELCITTKLPILEGEEICDSGDNNTDLEELGSDSSTNESTEEVIETKKTKKKAKITREKDEEFEENIEEAVVESIENSDETSYDEEIEPEEIVSIDDDMRNLDWEKVFEEEIDEEDILNDEEKDVEIQDSESNEELDLEEQLNVELPSNEDAMSDFGIKLNTLDEESKEEKETVRQPLKRKSLNRRKK